VLERPDSGVEALDVPDGENDFVLLGERDQAIGLVERRGDRLLDEYVLAGRDEGGRGGDVVLGRGDDRRGDDVRLLDEELLDRGDGATSVPLGQRLRAGEVDVDDRPQLGVAELVVVTRVVAAHVAGADDGDGQG
jgi:hypothetical protein